MKKVFITGGSGTVGSSFIEAYQDRYQFFSFSRNEKMQVSLKRRVPSVEIVMGAVEDFLAVHSSITKIRPDVIIHAAAMKHVDSAEATPIQAVKSNIIGSLNVINSAVENSVPTTVAISSDKACCPDSNYGYTKALTEKIFLEAHTELNKFALCRFGNVSHSHGSVIPYWLRLRAEDKPLPLTDKRMNRLMFSRNQAAELVHAALERAEAEAESFILSKAIKTVNMYELAKVISNDIMIVGLRPGEKLNETLVSEKEIPNCFIEENYLVLRGYENKGNNRLTSEYSSASADFMTREEMVSMVTETNENLNQSLLETRIY